VVPVVRVVESRQQYSVAHQLARGRLGRELQGARAHSEIAGVLPRGGGARRAAFGFLRRCRKLGGRPRRNRPVLLGPRPSVESHPRRRTARGSFARRATENHLLRVSVRSGSVRDQRHARRAQLRARHQRFLANRRVRELRQFRRPRRARKRRPLLWHCHGHGGERGANRLRDPHFLRVGVVRQPLETRRAHRQVPAVGFPPACAHGRLGGRALVPEITWRGRRVRPQKELRVHARSKRGRAPVRQSPGRERGAR